MKEHFKLLFISWTIPPSFGGSAYITQQLLKNFNVDEYLAVGGSSRFFSSVQNYNGVEYHYLFSEINYRGHGDRFFAPLRYLLFPLVLFRVWRLARKQKPNAILATFPDGYCLWIGYLLSIISKLPLYTYFHNTYSENRTGFSLWFAKCLQNKAFRKSRSIFTMSEGMLNFYVERYPMFRDKFKVLPHTFNEYPDIISNNQVPAISNRHRLIFIGTLNQSNLEASRRMFLTISKNASVYQLDIYSPSNKNLLKIKYGLDLDMPGIKHCGVVRQEEVNDILQGYDACILTHGFSGDYNEVEYQTIFPTRTIPFMLSGIPILAHTPPDTFITRFLRERDCAEVVDTTDERAIMLALDRVVHDKHRRKELIRNQLEAVRYFYGPEVVSRLKAIIMQKKL